MESLFSMNIYIFIEIKRRELSSRFLLALEAASRGHDVFLGDLSPYFKRNLFKPGVIHHKSITPKNERINELKRLKKKSFLFTSQDEESGHINDHPKEYIEARYGERSLKLVEKIFTWGKFDYDNLIKRYPRYKNKFSNTGNPRVDFWKKENQIFFDKKIINLKNYFLISSNFETICSYRNLPNTIHWLRELSYFKRGWDEEKIIDRATKEQLIFRDFVKFIKILSSKFPRKKIVFRPHPIEKESDWKKIFYDYKNIIVNNSNEIGHWITNSSLVIHNGCTGGLEASLRNKKVIAFSPKGLNIGHKFPNKVSFTYKNINDAIKAVQILENKNKVISFINKKNEVSNRLQNYFNKNAYISIVDEWEKISNSNLNQKNNLNKLRLLTNFLKVKLKLKNYKNLDNKFSDFNKIEVDSLIKSLSKINRNFKKLNVEILSGKLIRISKK